MTVTIFQKFHTPGWERGVKKSAVDVRRTIRVKTKIKLLIQKCQEIVLAFCARVVKTTKLSMDRCFPLKTSVFITSAW